MFEHLITRAEIIEAKLAARMGKKADAIQKHYSGRKGDYLATAFGLAYYIFSSIFLPVLSGLFIFLYVFLRYLLPFMYVLFCASSLASITSYLIESNVTWVMNNYHSLALVVFRPLLSDYVILLVYVIAPVFIVSTFFISLAVAMAIQYRKAIFADAPSTMPFTK